VAADECHGPESGAPAQPVIGTAAKLGDSGNARPAKKKAKKKTCKQGKKSGKRKAKKGCKKKQKVNRRRGGNRD
jgi:hypothetical protein